MQNQTTRTVVFITGAFVHHSCWDDWRNYFGSLGYSTIAPPWPHKNAPPHELRAKRPHDVDLALLTLGEVMEYYASLVRSLPEKPIIIGHSMGGLITQVLINRDLGIAGVAIHPVPPQGIIPYEFSFLRAGWKALGLFTSIRKTYLMSFEDWQYAFVNKMPLEAQRAAYERFTIPESKRVARGGLTSAAHVDFKKPHPPLLITSGSIDHIMPAHLNYRNYKRYRSTGSVIEYKEFPGRNHFVLGQPTWEEDASYIAGWLEQVRQ